MCAWKCQQCRLREVIASHLLLKGAFQDLLEGGHICEVVEGNAECHHVLSKAAQLALDQLCLSCRSASKSVDRTTITVYPI